MKYMDYKPEQMNRGTNYRINGKVVVIPHDGYIRYNTARDICRAIKPIIRQHMTGKHVKRAWVHTDRYHKTHEVLIETPNGKFVKYLTDKNFVGIAKRYGPGRVDFLI